MRKLPSRPALATVALAAASGAMAAVTLGIFVETPARAEWAGAEAARQCVAGTMALENVSGAARLGDDRTIRLASPHCDGAACLRSAD